MKNHYKLDLKTGLAVLILLFTILSMHSCKQERLQRDKITANKNKATGLKSNLQKSTQNVLQST